MKSTLLTFLTWIYLTVSHIHALTSKDCKKNEFFVTNYTGCDRYYCDVPALPPGWACKNPPSPRCLCKDGFYRMYNNECVLKEDCLDQRESIFTGMSWWVRHMMRQVTEYIESVVSLVGRIIGGRYELLIKSPNQ